MARTSGRRRRSLGPLAVQRWPRPVGASTSALARADFAASPPRITMRKAMQCTISGRSLRTIRRNRLNSRRRPTAARLPRSRSSEITRAPSASMRARCFLTRVATATSKPPARAARAIGRKCEAKNQSSLMRNRIFRIRNRASRPRWLPGWGSSDACIVLGLATANGAESGAYATHGAAAIPAGARNRLENCHNDARFRVSLC